MDDRRFDALTRALGGASTRRSALGALAGLLAGGAALGADAKKKRKKCDPACPAGQTCRQGACACDDGGAVCGANCCRTGQRCEGGACVDPAPQCIAAGEACKGTGRACCDGRTCASGQGGQDDVACYVPAGGSCERTAECAFGSTCEAGTCVAIPQPTPDNGGGGATGCSATGGDVSTAAGYRIHTFTTDGTLTFAAPCAAVEFLVVAGGGGGGAGDNTGSPIAGGGGGAGGVLTGTEPLSGAVAVTVGHGGVGPAGNSRAQGTTGQSSSLGDIMAEGGGGGGAGGGLGTNDNGRAGGSGGGAGWGGNAGTGIPTQGYDGAGAPTYTPGGGGGGSDSAGSGGDGGDAMTSDITGASQPYGWGGFGGGSNPTPGLDALPNTGDGGAGGGPGAKGGDGGSGIVIARYRVS